MTITFAGVPLLLDSPSGDIEQHIKRYWESPYSAINAPPRAIDTRSICQIPNWPDVPPLKLNQLYIPSGATRWARGMFLTDDEGMRKLADISYGTLEFGNEFPPTIATASSTSYSNPSNPRVSSTVSVSSNQWNVGNNFSAIMWKLDPIPISIKGTRIPGFTSSSTLNQSAITSLGNYYYLIPLVDERYFWQGLNIVTTATVWGDIAGPTAANPSSSGLPSSSVNGTSRFGLLGDIAAALKIGALGSPLAGDYISGSYYPISNPSYLAFRNGPIAAAAALDLLCWSNNLLLVPDDHTNMTTVAPSGKHAGGRAMRYRLLGAGVVEPQTSSSSGSPGKKQNVPRDLAIGQKNAILWAAGTGNVAGNDKYDAVAADVPASIRMAFSNPNILSQAMYTKAVTPQAVIVDVGTGIFNIKNLASADYGNTNSARLDAIANTWGRNWYENNRVRFDWVFNAMPILKFCGVEDFIMYDFGRRPKGQYTNTSRWVSLPSHYGFEFVAHETVEHKDDVPVTPTVSTTGCGCCNCFDCVSQTQATVGGCSAANPNGAAYQYLLDIGLWSLLTGIPQVLTLTYGAPTGCSSSSSSSSGGSGVPCRWYSCPYTVCKPSTSSSSGGGPCMTIQYQYDIYVDTDGRRKSRGCWVLLSGTDWLGMTEVLP